MKNEEAVPSVIRTAGDRAVAAYLDFFAGGNRSPNTLKVYGQHARRFFRWAEERGLTLESITATDISANFAEVSKSKSSHEASVYLTPVRGVFRQLVNSPVLSHNPCLADISLAELKEVLLDIDPTWEQDE